MTETTKIQRIIQIYYERLYATKCKNKEMDKFLEIKNQPKLNHKEL